MKAFVGAVAVLAILGMCMAHPWLWAVLGVLVAFTLRLRSAAGSAKARTISYHSHGHAPSVTCNHESGHIHATRKVGGHVVGAWVYKNGNGLTRVSHIRNPVDDIAVSWAGQFAAGTSSGCGGDQAAIRARLRSVPKADRARVAREGKNLGRRLGHSWGARQYASTLKRKGHL